MNAHSRSLKHHHKIIGLLHDRQQAPKHHNLIAAPLLLRAQNCSLLCSAWQKQLFPLWLLLKCGLPYFAYKWPIPKRRGWGGQMCETQKLQNSSLFKIESKVLLSSAHSPPPVNNSEKKGGSVGCIENTEVRCQEHKIRFEDDINLIRSSASAILNPI